MRKTFFQERRCAAYPHVLTPEHCIDDILALPEGEGARLVGTILPPGLDDPKKFLKHGRDVKIRRGASLERAVEDHLMPIAFRKMAFDDVPDGPIAGYSFKPFIGTDQRTRRVLLVECLEGARLFAYAHQERTHGFTPKIEVMPYADAVRVGRDGAEVVLRVPSRRKKHGTYEFKFHGVPVLRSRERWGIAYNVATTHSCMSKQYTIRYRFEDEKEGSRQFVFCAHEVAGYLAIIDHYKNVEHNLVPLEMSQLAIPTRATAGFYLRLCNQVVLWQPEGEVRHLNRAEKEVLLWSWVRRVGHDASFFAKREKVKDYAWT